jgi:hypothetical protein
LDSWTGGKSDPKRCHKIRSETFLQDVFDGFSTYLHQSIGDTQQRPNNGEQPGTQAGILNGTEGGGQGKGLRSWSTLRAASQICIPALKPAGHARSARINVEEK